MPSVLKSHHTHYAGLKNRGGQRVISSQFLQIVPIILFYGNMNYEGYF